MSRRNAWNPALALALAFSGAFGLVGCNGSKWSGGGGIRLPDLYVMASTSNDGHVETRVSPDGRLWSTANALVNADGTPASTSPTPPPGIGAIGTEYVIAWFDPSGTLHSQTSTDGVSWGGDTTHGSFAVDSLSRPAVVYGGSGAWFVGFSDSAGLPTVLRIRPTTSAVATVPSLAGARMLGMAYFGGSFFLAHKDGFSVRVLSTTNALAWPASTGVLARNGDGTVLTSNTWPQLATSPGVLWLAVDRASAPGVNGLRHGITSTHSSADGETWDEEHTYEPTHTNPNILGLALAGPQSAQILADHSAGDTDVFHSAGWTTKVATHSSSPVSLAFGPREPTSIRIPTITFRRFKRGGPHVGDPSAVEDVTLAVEHLDSRGRLARRDGPWEFRRAVKDTGHFFDQFPPANRSPEIRFVAQPGDTLRVRMSGDDGEVSGDVDVGTLLSTPEPAGGERLVEATQPSNRTAYQVWYSTD
ncbi:MAG: hypothetical protein ACRD2Z_18055 [Thermoanaerobaculia bacterium]